MDAKREILERLKRTYCRIKTSKAHGVGIFAIRDIPENVDPFYGVPKPKWFHFELSELEGLDPEVLKMVHDFFMNDGEQELDIPEHGLNGIDVSFFLNESEKPNIKTVDGGNKFRTMRKIKKGEELVCRYETYEIYE